MEVLYVTKTSLFSDGGGGEERARQVTTGLESRDHNVTVLCGKTDQDLQKWMTIGGCDVRHVTCIPPQLFRFSNFSFFATRYLFALTSLPVLLWILFRRDVDVIVENMTPYPSLSIIVAKLTGTPIVAVQHEFFNLTSYQAYDPVTATLLLLVQNILRIGTYHSVITPTTYVARKLADYGVDSSQIVVIPNGVEADKYHLPDVDRDPTSLITVGRLTKRKGQDKILNAFKKVQEQVPAAHLHILGKGPLREELVEISEELDISDVVTFHGYVNNERKVELMNEAGLFVFASRQEGYGLVVLEAMAAGLPVVAKKLPVYEDFFENGTNGYLVNTPVDENLAKATIILLYNHTTRQAISKRNRNKAAQYSWDQTVSEMEEVIITTSKFS